MKSFIAHLKKLDWVLVGALIILFLFGLVTLYASPEVRDTFYKQAVLGVAALVILFSMSALDYRIFRNHPAFLIALYILGIGSLVALFFFGARVRGVAGWFQLGPVALQPVELVKIIVVLVLAKYLSNRHIELYRLRHLFISGLYVLVPVVLVIAQPDLGSALVLVASWVGLVIISGIRLRQFALIVLLGVVVAGLLWSFGLQDYQRERIVSFANPEADPLGGSYQTRQALIAIGSGGIMGKGLGEGAQTRLGFLPEFQTDFIFAAIGEEWGFVGLFALLALLAVVFWRLYVIWLGAANNFARLFIGGMFVLLGVHVILNIGANLGMLPITGLPLPFVSAGGSNLISFAIGMGIVLSIHAHSHAPQDFIGRSHGEVEVL